jgi:hypothetical protein
MAYARNISNQAVYLEGITGAFVGPSSFAANIASPRTYGAHVTVKF